MSARIRAVSSRRVVDRPAPAAPLHVDGVRRGDRRERRVVGRPRGEGLEEGRDRLVVASRQLGERHRRRTDRSVDHAGDPRRDVHERTRRLDDDETITGSERLGELGADGDHPVAAEHDRLPGSQVRERADVAHRAAVTVGRFGARMGGMNPLVLAPAFPASPRLAPVVVALISERVGR